MENEFIDLIQRSTYLVRTLADQIEGGSPFWEEIIEQIRAWQQEFEWHRGLTLVSCRSGLYEMGVFVYTYFI